MERFSIREALEMAIRTERLGFTYYNELAEKFKNNKPIHELFTKLAEREVAHEHKFIDLKKLVGDAEPDNWEEVSEYMRAYVEGAFFLGREQAFSHMQSVTDVFAAVGFAIGFEKETLLFFYNIREVVEEKEIVDEIIQEEKNHITWLTRFKKQANAG